jgi:hypothetical protein
MGEVKEPSASPEMVKRLPFSQRHETRRPTEGLIYDHVPDRVKAGLLNILDELSFPLEGPDSARKLVNVCRGLDQNGLNVGDYAFPFEWRVLVYNLPWDEFCDACEVIWQQVPGFNRDSFSNALNALLSRNYFGYELRNGLMEKVGARVQEAAIAEARGILRDPDLSGPDEQYQKAVGFFNRRPEPDCENCVKEAVSAVEGVARVLLNDNSVVLSDAIKRLKKEKDLHPILVKLLSDLYAYRGDAEGVAHALTGDKEVRIEEAEFVLGVSASAIVYLARLFGRGVE